MCEVRRRIVRTFAVPDPRAAGPHRMLRSYTVKPVRIDEVNYPLDSCRHGIVVTGRAAAMPPSVPIVTVDSSYAAIVPITLLDLDVRHTGIALKIDGDASCTLKVEGNVFLSGAIGVQGGGGVLTLDAAEWATLRGVGIQGEGGVFPGRLTLTGAGVFEFIASEPYAGIRCPEGALMLEGASKLTVSGGYSSPNDRICCFESAGAIDSSGCGLWSRNGAEYPAGTEVSGRAM